MRDNEMLLQIRNAVKDVCLDIGSGNTSSLQAESCHGLRGNQGFMFSDDHQIRSGKYCLAAQSAGTPVQKVTCIDRNDGITEQYWKHDKKVSQRQFVYSMESLSISHNLNIYRTEQLNMRPAKIVSLSLVKENCR